MSSVQSAFAQVGPREKYLVATGAATNVVVNAGEVVTSSISQTDFEAVTTAGTAITSGQLFLDLGKTVVVHGDNTLLAVEKYQKVQLVKGADTEGNNVDTAPAGDLYVRVWTSAGSAPLLARLG
jgi:hypothetical protein